MTPTVIVKHMANPSPDVKKKQIDLAAYLKIKEARMKSKMKLHFPMMVKAIIAVPAAYFIFLVVYFLLYLRFVAEH